MAALSALLINACAPDGKLPDGTKVVPESDVPPAQTDIPITMSFLSGTISAAEPDTTATLTVILSAAASENVTVDYEVLGGTATGGGTDYDLVAGTLTFAPGDTQKTIDVSLIDDAIDEDDETVIVALGNPAGAQLGGTGSTELTITDDDPEPTVAFDLASSSAAEPSIPVQLGVSLSESSIRTVTVSYAVTGGTATGAGVDYTLAAGVLTFAPGQTAATIDVAVVDDTSDEPNETIAVTLSSPSAASLGAITTHTYTINDNDNTPAVAFAAGSSSASEAVTAAGLEVILTAASGYTVTVDYAVTGGTATGGGTDYSLASGTLTFNPGEVSRNIAFTVVDDSDMESDETVQVTLSAPSNATLGAQSAHTYTILDNDTFISFASAVSSGVESATPAQLSVVLSGTSSQTVTVDYTVTGGTAVGGGTDYTLASGTLSYSPGTTSQPIDLTVIGDALPESEETVQVTLSDPANGIIIAPSSHTFTILDDDSPPTVVLSSTAPDPTRVSPVPVTATFNEDVTGFAAGDLVIGNGSVSNFVAQNARVYTFDVTPAGPDLVTVDVPAGVALDPGATGNLAAAQLSRLFDSVRPTVTISSISPSPTDSVPIPVSVAFDEDVTGFAIGDLSIGNGSASNFVAVDVRNYTFDLNPSAYGLVTVNIAADAAFDGAGNGNSAAAQFSISYGTGPSVAITSGEQRPTSSAYFLATITFSESVTGFALGDISVGNGSASQFGQMSGSVYTVRITPAAPGLVTVDVPAAVAQNGSSQPNLAAPQFSITYNVSAPSAPTGLALQNPASSPGTVANPTIRVSGVQSGDTVRLYSDIACTNLVGSTISAGTTADVTVSPLADGEYTFFATRDNGVAESGCSSAYVAYSLSAGFTQVDTLDVLGNWSNVAYDDRDWTILTGGTPSAGVGPTAGDGGGGGYAYTEASNPTTAGNEFVLESNLLDAGAYNLVFEFKYNKRGGTMGDLYVEVSPDGGTTWDAAIWSHLGADVATNGADVWRTQQLNLCGLGYSSGNIKVRFRGVMPSAGTIWNSDIAVDSPSFWSGSCVGLAVSSPSAGSQVNFANQLAFPVSGTCSENGQPVQISGDASATATCTGGTWTANLNFSGAPDGTVTIQASHSDAGMTSTVNRTISFSKDTSVIQEDLFDSDLGNWSNVTYDNRDWSWITGGTPSNGVGPTAGDGGSGGYIFTEASNPTAANDVFAIESNPISASGVNLGIQFKYNKRGTTMGNLYLEVSTDGGSSWSAPVWSHLGADIATNGADAWRSQTVNLCGAGYNSGTVKVRIRGVMPSAGTIWNSDMALDTIRFTNEPGCP